ncbi:MAG: bifunctional diaminohydroxyphosphoribosylaminopyrimidine deaminase/5-amino-6-(5-phosphoribosylamino)uracil reductase RibD [Chloroflexi bacterium]|nr:bifunctional diaminohydroxyphosphoribosylaminopyrimidine deaminase/5-amino-6-(5-phosphoribosylamino)uracil reductase RibD [Chloroflexota bacterium]
MAQALELARQALGQVSPNPAVGAVLVKEDKVVGQGYTQPPGGPHAEIVALQQAGERSRGATLYVTLEPCCHYGRTPPCTDALLAAGVSDVHMSVVDPNPLVAGKGKRQLEDAGLRVNVGDGDEEARRLNEAYFKHIVSGLPFVTAKFATSLDGKIATATGESRWITGEEARRTVHQMRAVSDAVMVGIDTALADDPQLTAREGERPLERQPLRVVVDSTGRLPARARLLAGPGRALVATARMSPSRRSALERSGAEVVSLPGEDGRVDLPALLRLLGQRGVMSILVEGGGALLGSFFQQRLVDKVVAFIAPIIIGGREAPSPVGGQGFPSLSEALRLHLVTVESVGEDLMLTGYPPADQEGGA